MSANIIRLLPDEERALLECYVTGSTAARVLPAVVRRDGGTRPMQSRIASR